MTSECCSVRFKIGYEMAFYEKVVKVKGRRGGHPYY